MQFEHTLRHNLILLYTNYTVIVQYNVITQVDMKCLPYVTNVHFKCVSLRRPGDCYIAGLLIYDISRQRYGNETADESN